MAYFTDEAEVYAYIGRFQDLAADEELGPKFRKANTIVQYRYREPQSQITVELMEDGQGRVECGPTDMEPEVVMTMDADTAHRFWLGHVNVTVALARGQIKARGRSRRSSSSCRWSSRRSRATARCSRSRGARTPGGRLMEATPADPMARRMAGFKDFYHLPRPPG